MIIAVGLASDASAHYCHAFLESSKPTSRERAVEALDLLGATRRRLHIRGGSPQSDPRDDARRSVDLPRRHVDVVWYWVNGAEHRAVTKLHGAFKVHFLCARQRGAGASLNTLSKFWRIMGYPDPVVGYRTG